MFGSPQFGARPFAITPREDPGEDVIFTRPWIVAQTVGCSDPGNVAVARAIRHGYERTLGEIHRLPETAYHQPNH